MELQKGTRVAKQNYETDIFFAAVCFVSFVLFRGLI
jgi:hypothetical protein